MHSDYRKEIEASSKIPTTNGHKADCNYITIDYILRSVGSKGIPAIERDSMPPQELQYRGAQTISSTLFPWYNFGKSATLDISDLVTKISKLAYLQTPEQQAKLSEILNAPSITLPLSQNGSLKIERQSADTRDAGHVKYLVSKS